MHPIQPLALYPELCNSFFPWEARFQFNISCYMNEIPINANIYAHIFSAHIGLILAPIETRIEAAVTAIFNRCVKVCAHKWM